MNTISIYNSLLHLSTIYLLSLNKFLDIAWTCHQRHEDKLRSFAFVYFLLSWSILLKVKGGNFKLDDEAGEKVVTIIFNHIMVKDGLTKLMKPPKPKGHSSAKIWLQKSAKIFLTNLTEEFCFHVLYLDRSPAFLTLWWYH